MDGHEYALFLRLVLAAERLADHFAPQTDQREKRPATLTTAIYDADERERQSIKKAWEAQKQAPGNPPKA